MTTLHFWLLGIFGLVLLWCLVPVVCVLRLPGVPALHRRRAALSFLRASVRGLATLPADVIAPLVVPLALLGCKWESERLPRWARWWDNDVGLNGDNFPVWNWNDALGHGVPAPVPLDDTPAVRALCYWAEGHHPRSWWARFVWLGLRNRASALSLQLGHRIDPGQPVDEWGDAATGRSQEGWVLRHHNGVYQLHATRRAGPLCLRMNYGHKINFVALHRPRMPVVCITLSALSWKAQVRTSV